MSKIDIQEPESYLQKGLRAPPQIVKGLETGDTLVIRVGIMNMGDGLPPWIPHESELIHFAKMYEEVVPPGVNVIVHHFGAELQVIKNGKEG